MKASCLFAFLLTSLVSVRSKYVPLSAAAVEATRIKDSEGNYVALLSSYNCRLKEFAGVKQVSNKHSLF